MKKIILISLLFIGLSSYAQLSLSIYNEKAMGLSFPVNSRLLGEFRAYSNMYVKDMKLEPMVLFNVSRTRQVNIYTGLGFVFLPSDLTYMRVSVPVGVHFCPFKDFRNLAFVVEVAPEIYDEVFLRSTWGIRYVFMKQG